jgi:hypothetical protein
MGKVIKTTMRIEKIQEVKTHTKNTDKQMYKLRGKDSDGVGNVVIALPINFDGFKPDMVVDISLSTSQTSLSDFEKAEDKRKEKPKKEKE